MNFRRIIQNVLLLTLLSFPILSYAQAFEGILEVSTIDKAKGNNESKWYLGKGNLKIAGSAVAKEGTMQFGLIFPKGENGAKFLTQGGNGEWMVFNVSQAQMQNKTNYGNVRLQKTNEVKDIAGVKCTLYKDDMGKVTVWATDGGLLSVNDLPAILVNNSEMDVIVTNGITGFPMEIVAKDESGNIAYSQKVKSIQKTTVSESEFNYSQYRSGEEVMKEAAAQQVKH